MDVTWTEPFDPEDPILKFPNVLISPHIAGVTEHSYRAMAKVIITFHIVRYDASVVLLVCYILLNDYVVYAKLSISKILF